MYPLLLASCEWSDFPVFFIIVIAHILISAKMSEEEQTSIIASLDDYMANNPASDSDSSSSSWVVGHRCANFCGIYACIAYFLSRLLSSPFSFYFLSTFPFSILF